MEIPWARATDTASWEVAAGLTLDEYRAVKAALRSRGLEGAPAYGAWLRTELLKASMRKQAAMATAAAAGSSTVAASGPAAAAA